MISKIDFFFSIFAAFLIIIFLDWITRRLRYCARIYLEHKRSVGLVEALVAENRNPKDARPYEHLIAVLKKAAGEESGDFIPDDYFWRVLIFFLQKSGAPTQEVHNVWENLYYVLGEKSQKNVPISLFYQFCTKLIIYYGRIIAKINLNI